ncbi:MAG: gluconate transporter, partial [Bacteroidia bacterium]|nr:gluconate transporter [Bacteroidia bacterium]
VYILMSIGFGSLFVPWMNDSGFWVVSRMSGMTTGEALKNYTVTIGSLAVIGLVELLIMSGLLPLVYLNF